MREKFQLPSGHSWRALSWEDSTVIIKSNIHPPTIDSRCHVFVSLNHFYNWKEGDLHPRCTVFSHQSNMRELAQELMSYVNRTRQQSSHLIRDLRSKRHPGAWTRGETKTFVLLEGLKQRGLFFCLCANSPNPRQETRRPDFPRFLCRKKKKIRNKQWEKTWRLWVKCGYRFICTLKHRGEWQAKSIVILNEESSWLSKNVLF